MPGHFAGQPHCCTRLSRVFLLWYRPRSSTIYYVHAYCTYDIVSCHFCPDLCVFIPEGLCMYRAGVLHIPYDRTCGHLHKLTPRTPRCVHPSLSYEYDFVRQRSGDIYYDVHRTGLTDQDDFFPGSSGWTSMMGLNHFSSSRRVYAVTDFVALLYFWYYDCET